jgi:hypothetical protein
MTAETIGSRKLLPNASPRSKRYGPKHTDGQMILGPDFSAFVEYCEREGVRYVIVT